jgi:hypothetical protein
MAGQHRSSYLTSRSVLKRVLVHLSALNLSLAMRQRFGKGTPRGWQGCCGGGRAAPCAALDHSSRVRSRDLWPVQAVSSTSTFHPALGGGHSASERLVTDIYEKSKRNLLTALDFAESGVAVVRTYDDSELRGHLRQVLSFRPGRPRSIAGEIPRWLESRNSIKEVPFRAFRP